MYNPEKSIKHRYFSHFSSKFVLDSIFKLNSNILIDFKQKINKKFFQKILKFL